MIEKQCDLPKTVALLREIADGIEEQYAVLERERDEARLMALDARAGDSPPSSGHVAQARFEQRRYAELKEQLEAAREALREIEHWDNGFAAKLARKALTTPEGEDWVRRPYPLGDWPSSDSSPASEPQS